MAENENENESDERAVLVTYASGPSELIYLTGSQDEELDGLDEIVDRVKGALAAGSELVRVGDSYVRTALIRSIAPHEGVELPETGALNEAEQRAVRMLNTLELVSTSVPQLLQQVTIMAQQQAALQQAQAQLFQALEAEDEVMEEVPVVSAPAPTPVAAGVPKARAGLKAMKFVPPAAT